MGARGHELSFRNKFLICFGKSACTRKATSGQLAVGLAFAFAGILAMFGLVYNASLNTHEKMKLQQTADEGTMYAANTQRYGLNVIRSYNKQIETEWNALEIILNIPLCNKVIGECLGSPACVIPTANAEAAALTGVPNDLEVSTSIDVCDSACDQYDNRRQAKVIQLYKSLQSLYATKIMNIDQDINGVAFDDALNTFLYPKNLPSDLRISLQKKLGRGFTVSDVRRTYDRGDLSQIPNAEYSYLVESNKDDPLFVPQQESRVTLYSGFFYATTRDPYTGQAIECIPASPIGIPKKTIVPLRITRQGDYTTQFFTSIKYQPPESVIEQMLTLGVRNPDSKDPKFGQESEDVSGKDRLFRRRTQQIQAISAAKPYGGTFPEAGIAGYGGTSGNEFTGVKFFGVADKEEVGGQRLDRLDSAVDRVDDRGNIIGSIPYAVEDILH